jgi:hypothetical protein
MGLTDDDEVCICAQGPVLLHRDPIIHVSDIQTAKAVGEEEVKARQMKDWDPIVQAVKLLWGSCTMSSSSRNNASRSARFFQPFVRWRPRR